MYIHEVRIRNFRSLRNSTVKLFPVTAFVGPGGGGKSNFFDALLNLSIVLRGRVGEAFSPYPSGTFAATRCWDALPVESIGFVAKLCPRTAADDLPFVYEFQYKQTPSSSYEAEPTFQIIKETLSRGEHIIFDRDNLTNCQMTAKNHIADDRSLLAAIRFASFTSVPHGANKDLVELAKGISHVGKYRLDPILLSRPSNLPMSQDPESSKGIWLDYRGENLAAVLYQLQETNAPVLLEIVSAIKEVFPDFGEFAFNFIGEGRVGFSVRYTHHREPILAPALSHGTLLFIGLMTLLHMPNRPDVLALEEPENGLTPGAIRVLYRKLVESIGPDPSKANRQILLSSHSPFVLYEAWNGPTREYIYQVTQSSGCSTVTSMKEVLTTYSAALQSDGTISIRAADRIMSEGWQV